ncbi:uncharacterized protein LOC108223448 [Daucus carota subsp. sativus]|uniref:uncharacterized protein LOC108223448 n=1 Tax=Daucus carota subsp. sativus TaxID=79200 RepID=UPI003082B883
MVGYEGVHSEVDAVQEIPTGETQAKGEDNVDDLLLQMRQTKIKGKRCVPLPSVSSGSDVPSIQEGVSRAEEGSCEQGEKSVYPSDQVQEAWSRERKKPIA